MASGFRGFVVFVLAMSIVGLGAAAIGLTQDRAYRANEWRVVDEDAAVAAGITRAREYFGQEHCGWETVRFLDLFPFIIDATGRMRHRQFVRDPDRVIGNPPVSEPLRTGVKVPEDAVFTGMSRDGSWLWLDADGRAAYVVRYGTAERWPQTKYTIGCD